MSYLNGKGKRVMSLSMPCRCTRRAEVQLHSFLNFALDNVECSTLYPINLFLENTLYVGNWVAPRPGLDVFEKRRIHCPKNQTLEHSDLT
jgi:hypothetical protein